MTSFPPCLKSLQQLIKRANFQTAIWKGADEPFLEIPEVEDNGWVVTDQGLEPCWCKGEVLPKDLSSLLDDDILTDSEEEYMFENINSSEDSDSE